MKTTIAIAAFVALLPACSAVAKPSAWARTKCGSPEGKEDNTDIITEWGKKITPESVKTVFDYPRPQMVRSSFTNLNGLWEFKAVEAGTSTKGAFGNPLNETILVPFPVESCLSGLKDVNDTNGVPPTYQHMWYRTTVSSDQFQAVATGRTLLHFGAVDWQTDVYVNGLWVGSNTGGYNSFSFDVTEALSGGDGDEEIFVVVYDPSNMGPQPFGKQRISARYNPGGDTYTPNSGIWQTVWMESVPETYIEGLKIQADMKQLAITVNTNVPDGSPVTVKVKDSSGNSDDGSSIVATSDGCKANLPCVVTVPSPKLWSPESPFLYNMTVTAGDDSVDGYFGMREVKLGKDAGGTTRPMINGKFRFLAGFLDQSWWPDGQYLAPGDEALASDVVVLKTWGMNMIRLHQKVNPQRWYYAADKAGIVILQDMVQHYGDGAVRQGGLPAEARYYWSDLKAMIDGIGNHPSIIQWEVFNEGDMVSHFDAAKVVEWTKKYDTTRLVDTNSGGAANNLHVGDVNDIHSYPWPGSPKPSDTQAAMIGEFGGIGCFQEGHMWTPKGCHTYLHVPDAANESATYVQMVDKIIAERKDVSYSVYTQTTDLENECDGFLNYDRVTKFNAEQTASIKAANEKLVGSPVDMVEEVNMDATDQAQDHVLNYRLY